MWAAGYSRLDPFLAIEFRKAFRFVEVELVGVGDVAPYERNPRKNADAIAKVKTSIQEFGFRQPIVVDAKRVIIVGHTRWMAAKELSLKKVPVHVATDLTPEQVRAYRIADNRVAETAEWDFELLDLEIEDLKGEGYDIELTGFDLDELERGATGIRPDDFESIDDTIETTHECPKCGYEF